jgi:Flp pilus assembly protein TadG
MRRRNKSKRTGVVAVEMAICVPLLLLLLVMMLDIWRAHHCTTSLQAMAESGAQYGSIGNLHSTDTTQIESAALLNRFTENNPKIDSWVETHNGESYIVCKASVVFDWFSPIPNLPNTLQAQRTYIIHQRKGM